MSASAYTCSITRGRRSSSTGRGPRNKRETVLSEVCGAVQGSPLRSRPDMSAGGDTTMEDSDGPVRWWEADEVLLVATHLEGASLGAFCCCCSSVAEHMRSRDTLRWLADLRGLGDDTGISCVEHIELAEAMGKLDKKIFFGWGSLSVDRSIFPSMHTLARLLSKHSSLTLSIEAHCGLEAKFAMPLPGQARDFTRARAAAVRDALFEQSTRAGIELDAARVLVRAWGCSRPLVWCFGQPGMGEPYDPEGAAKNRRVELFLRSGAFEIPRRRKRSEIPRPPGATAMEDVTLPPVALDDTAASESHAGGAGQAGSAAVQLALDDDPDDGTADAGTAPDELITLQLADGAIAPLAALYTQPTR